MGQEIPVHAGEICEMEIERLGSNAEGVGRIDGFTVFVPGALPGERVRLKITVVKKKYAVGAVEKRLTDSPDRVVPRCPIYEACGGYRRDRADRRIERGSCPPCQGGGEPLALPK